MKQLFNIKTITKKCKNIDLSDKQKKSAVTWLNMINEGKLEDEESNYLNFYQIILHDILGYNSRDIKYEKNNVEFQIIDSDGKIVLCCEMKGTRIKDLYAVQHYGKKELRTPINQTHYYMYKLDLDYGLCSNYKKFILLDKDKNTYEFDFESIKNNELKLKEFITMFSKATLTSSNFLKTFHNDSELEEKEFTKQFYNLFHETRLMMIKEFQEKNNMEKSISIHMTQIILNRLIFIFFAEDTDLIFEKRLFYNRMLRILRSNTITDISKKIFEDIKDIFIAFDKGSDTPPIFPFNGGLFSGIIPDNAYFRDKYEKNFFNSIPKNSKLSKLKLHDDVETIIDRIGNLNPIIHNLLIMESFDFNTEINVNILGHIFEQSISDLEDLQKNLAFTKNKSGIYYTPEYITDYICRNTIIPYLSKSGKTSNVYDLLDEYDDDLFNLEKKFHEIKIIDPACGSGAFLLKSIDVLLDVGKAIIDRKQSRGLYYRGEQSLLTKWNEESEIERIVENNVYGIDIYQQSIDVTKLSFCLKLVAKDRKLPDLGKNIVVGNSLIPNKNIDTKAIDWPQKFPNVINNGGFDVVVGNPPYIPLELMNDIEKNYYSKNYDGIYRKYDSSILFVEKCMKNMKKNGYLGFIMPLTWQTGDNYLKFRKLIFQKFKSSLSNIINLPFNIFSDAYVDTGIAIFNAQQRHTSFHAIEYPKNKKINMIDSKLTNKISFKKILSHPEFKVFLKNATYDNDNNFEINNVEQFGMISKSTQGIVTSKYKISENKESENHMPFLLSAKSNRYLFEIIDKGFIDIKSIPNISYLYTRPKIMIRRIVNRQNRLMAFYDDSKIITNKDHNPFILISDDYDIFYILSLLNSKLFSYWYVQKSSLALKDDFRQTTLSEIRKLLIKKIDKIKQKKLSDDAKKITKLTHDHYIVKNKIHRRISDNFNIRINKKLEDLQHIDFLTFKREIEKLSKTKLSLNNQDEWEEYFSSSVKQLSELSDKISSLDNLIDNEIYKLHDISDEEKKIIDETIHDQKL